MGFGQLATFKSSILERYPTKLEVYVQEIYKMFQEAIAVYRNRMLNSLNPFYWINCIIFLPKSILQYLGLSTESDTKTDNSFRTLSLALDLTSMLQQWREEVKAAAKRRAKRNKVVLLDDPVGPEKWVFSQANGKVGHPHSFNCFLKAFCKEHNLPSIGPLVFRHLSGSYLLKSGVDIATVSNKLGHSDKSFTLKTYIHEIQSAEQQSAVVMQEILNDLKAKDKKDKQNSLSFLSFTRVHFNVIVLRKTAWGTSWGIT